MTNNETKTLKKCLYCGQTIDPDSGNPQAKDCLVDMHSFCLGKAKSKRGKRK